MRRVILVFAMASLSCGKARPGAVKPTLVSLNPAATEMVFALGAEDHLLAVSDFCDYPPAARDLPSVGDLVKPDLETLRAMNPDYVILFLPTQAQLKSDLEKLGLATVDISPENPAEVLESIRQLGSFLGVQERAKQLADSLRAEESAIVAPGVAPTVFIELGVNPVYTAGAGTFPGSLVEAAGGRNIFDDLQGYAPVQDEEVVARRPDFILMAHEGPDPRERLGWPAARVIRIDPDLVSRPGPRYVQAIKMINESFR